MTPRTAGRAFLLPFLLLACNPPNEPGAHVILEMTSATLTSSPDPIGRDVQVSIRLTNQSRDSVFFLSFCGQRLEAFTAGVATVVATYGCEVIDGIPTAVPPGAAYVGDIRLKTTDAARLREAQSLQLTMSAWRRNSSQPLVLRSGLLPGPR